MTELVLKLFGIHAAEAGDVARTAIDFHGANLGYVVLAAVGLGAGVLWLYRREATDLPLRRKMVLGGLRTLLLVLILGLLLRPVLAVTFEHAVRRTLLLLVDSSGSMSQIRDQRSSEEDLKRAALAADLMAPAEGMEGARPRIGAEWSRASRIELVRAALRSPRIDLVNRLAKDYDLAAFSFDRGLSEIPGAYRSGATTQPTRWLDSMRVDGKQTAVGDAIREVISRKRGQPLAGIVMVTDGASNSGYQPLESAKLAGQDGVPLYIWGVGITSPRDIAVNRHILVQDVAFAKDELPITVRVRSTGMAGQSANLVVTMGQEKTERAIEFAGDGEQVVTVRLTPKTPGEFEIKAEVPAREDEVVKDNNVAVQRVRVVDDKIKVLMVEQYPRWEFKYAQAVLMRDRRIELKCVLLEGDAGIAKEKNSPYLADFPSKKEDLFKYDLLILGDVDPKTFVPSQMEMIREFVEKIGGAMVVVAGKRFSPNAYRRTAIEKMLPVELESADVGAPPLANKPIRPELTPAGKSSFMLRLAEKDLESHQKWAQLPPIYWAAKVARARPAAEVLLVDPDPAKASRYGKMPILATQQYGAGQVLFLGTDNLWRWRRNDGERYYTMIWSQLAQRMALPHLLGESKRTQLTSDQREYTVGQKITIYGRLYGEGFEPMSVPTVRAGFWVAGGEANAREVLMRPVPKQPGMYRGEFIAPAAGAYRFAVEHDKAKALEFVVTDPQQELAESAMNKALLEQMAAVSGGLFLREEDLAGLPEKIQAKAERKRSTVEVEIWSSPLYFLLVLGVVTAEWIGRKMGQLK